MKKIPVLINFDQSRQIGTLEIDETQLPEYSDYVFAIGYLADQISLDRRDKVAELVEVSLLTDTQYISYLKQTGKI